MVLSEIDQAIEICEKHLRATGSYNTEIETFLVRFLLVFICSEYEKTINTYIAKRAERSNDARLVAFVQASITNIVRGIRLSDLTNVLSRFGEDLKDRFVAGVGNTEAQQAYDSILSNRHSFAHGGNVQVTFAELQSFYGKSVDVIATFVELIESAS